MHGAVLLVLVMLLLPSYNDRTNASTSVNWANHRTNPAVLFCDNSGAKHCKQLAWTVTKWRITHSSWSGEPPRYGAICEVLKIFLFGRTYASSARSWLLFYCCGWWRGV